MWVVGLLQIGGFALVAWVLGYHALESRWWLDIVCFVFWLAWFTVFMTNVVENVTKMRKERDNGKD